MMHLGDVAKLPKFLSCSADQACLTNPLFMRSYEMSEDLGGPGGHAFTEAPALSWPQWDLMMQDVIFCPRAFLPRGCFLSLHEAVRLTPQPRLTGLTCSSAGAPSCSAAAVESICSLFSAEISSCFLLQTRVHGDVQRRSPCVCITSDEMWLTRSLKGTGALLRGFLCDL